MITSDKVIHICEKCEAKEETEESTIFGWLYDGIGNAICRECQETMSEEEKNEFIN